MHQLLEFIVNHWILNGIFIVLLIVLVFEEARAQGMGRFGLSPQALTHLMNRESPLLLDMRDHKSFKEGHIIGSVNLPHESLEHDFKKYEKDKSQTIVVICTEGQKAAIFAGKMRKKGFENMHILSGGIGAWKTAHMPLVKK